MKTTVSGHHECIHIAGTTVPYTKGVCVWKGEREGCVREGRGMRLSI